MVQNQREKWIYSEEEFIAVFVISCRLQAVICINSCPDPEDCACIFRILAIKKPGICRVFYFTQY
jgi:hypothetical protein